MNCQLSTSVIIMVGFVAGMLPVPHLRADHHPAVHFDLPQVAAAEPSQSAISDSSLVTVQLRLSSMIESPEAPRIDQWLVRCQPRDSDVRIADYAPRTETSSDLASPIQVKQSEEESHSFGLSVDGAYGHAVRANSGLDRGKKNTSTLQFDKVAPMQVVTASGTINRGRGVYFKLRWTAEQILEGEKTFDLTLRVPPQWRGSLVDVSVVAHAERKSFGGWDRPSQTIGSANFVVAVYREGDHEAATSARALSDAEHVLRNIVAEQRGAFRGNSLPSMLRHVAMKLELEPGKPEQSWLERLLLERADPNLDQEIRKLPMPVRVAVLDYADVRNDFCAMNTGQSQRVLVARPAQ
jgi:hypothetical protein